MITFIEYFIFLNYSHIYNYYYYISGNVCLLHNCTISFALNDLLDTNLFFELFQVNSQ